MARFPLACHRQLRLSRGKWLADPRDQLAHGQVHLAGASNGRSENEPSPAPITDSADNGSLPPVFVCFHHRHDPPRVLRGAKEDHLPFVGEKQRIEPQDLADPPYLLPDGHVLFAQFNETARLPANLGKDCP